MAVPADGAGIKISTSTNDTNYAIITLDRAENWIFENADPVELTSDDIRDIDEILCKCINNYNLEQEKRFDALQQQYPEQYFDKTHRIIDLNRYKRQYVAVLNEYHAKEVWVNCVCDNDDWDWKTKIILVKNGERCFFQLKMNLASKEYYDFVVNGKSIDNDL